MTLIREDIKTQISNKISSNYFSKLVDSDYISFSYENEDAKIEFSFRIQFNRILRFQGFSVFSSKKIEKQILNIVDEELKNYYDAYFYFTPKDFYFTDYNFSQEIKSETHLEEFLNEFVICLDYHEQEIFPKLLDINFLAEYVGSVPFERQTEIPVGGNFPVFLFKKLAILKWGNQEERYLEYKTNTEKLIESYSIKKPEKYKPSFETGFKNLIKHLENEPNPLKKNNIC